MGELLFIDVAQKRRDERLQSLWDAYRAAQQKAQALQREDQEINQSQPHWQDAALFWAQVLKDVQP